MSGPATSIPCIAADDLDVRTTRCEEEEKERLLGLYEYDLTIDGQSECLGGCRPTPAGKEGERVWIPLGELLICVSVCVIAFPLLLALFSAGYSCSGSCLLFFFFFLSRSAAFPLRRCITGRE